MNSLKPFLILIASIFFFFNGNAQLNFLRNDNFIVLNANGDTLKNAWAGGFNSAQFSEIDLNLDGTMDLLAFDKADNRLIPFINNGIANQSSYTHAPQYISDFPKLHDWVLLRDYNCDGKMDIFTYSNGGMSIYKNTSTSSLSFVKQVEVLFSNYQPNFVNLYISSQDIPAIDDIDGDGDLDILTFSILGSNVEYHKNLSMETYGTCDSLTFELRNKCWGFFKENLSTNSVTLFDTCQFNIPNPEKITGGNKHSGSTLLTLDVDANNSKDLVLGDVSFNNMNLLINTDTSPNLTASSVTSQDNSFPANNSSTTAVDINIFPAGYYLDLNNDNIKDLVVAPNCTFGCKNSNNTWLYENSNANNNPNFSLTNTSFLQDGMIEEGEGTKPTFFDYNADGLLDIVIGNYGDFNSNYATGYKSSLWLYENVGTLTVPAYQLVDSDYVNISTMNLNIIGNQPALRITPTFGDLDGDNDIDMIIGDYQGYLHYFENTAGAGNTAAFSLNAVQYQSIDVGNFASPQLIDLDRDNLLDLVIGRRDGFFSYYRNEGTINIPSFSYVTDTLGAAKTRRYNEFNGNSTPFIFEDPNGNYMMLAGSTNGYIYAFDNIDGNLGGTFNVIDSTYLNIWEGSRSAPTLADINNDGNLDMLLGNFTGGAVFFKGDFSTSINKNNIALPNIQIYPNPTKSSITINLRTHSLENATIEIINLLGEVLTSKKANQQQVIMNLSNYANGIYFVRFTNDIESSIYKVVKE